MSLTRASGRALVFKISTAAKSVRGRNISSVNYIRSYATMSSFPPPQLRQLAQEVSTLLKERNETVAVAETAAGGLVSASLLAMPGASKYYKGGLTVRLFHSYYQTSSPQPLRMLRKAVL